MVEDGKPLTHSVMPGLDPGMHAVTPERAEAPADCRCPCPDV